MTTHQNDVRRSDERLPERSEAARKLPNGVASVLGLQRSAGNRATTTLIQRALLQRNGGGGGGAGTVAQPFNKWSKQSSSRGHGGERKARWLREQEAPAREQEAKAKAETRAKIKAEKRAREAKIKAVKRYMEDVVAPWATQARIAELINTNFEEMKTDPNLTEEPTYLTPAEKRKPESTDPQIAPGDVSFIAPTKIGDTAIHRGIVGIEVVDDKPYARVYSALWAEARPDKEGKVVYKDVHQDPVTGAISIHTGRDQGEKNEFSLEDDEETSPNDAGTTSADAKEKKKHPIMWLSAEPLRQLKWFYKYPIEKYNPGAKPVVRSFLIPLDLWTDISRQAVSEDVVKDTKNLDKPFNVDTAYGSNQFGVRGPLLEEVRKRALKNSLVSYVGDASHSKPEHGGTIRDVKDLHEQLGAPRTDPPVTTTDKEGKPTSRGIWVDPAAGKFVRTGHQGGIANALSFYHAVWTGNKLFLPEDKTTIPKSRLHDMFREFLRKNRLELPADYELP